MSLVNFSLLLVLQCLQLCVEAAQPEPQSQAQAHEAYKYRAATDQSILNGAQGTIGQSVRDELKNSEIISDVIDDFHPTLLINITYPTTNTTANLGNTITPSSAQDPPTIELYTSSSSSPSSSSASSPATNYTLVLTDPDAPSRSDPKWSEFCHWIITNVPLSPSSSPEKVSSTEAQTAAQGLKELIPYAPPAPPPKTGSHRYAFLAFAPKSSQVAGAGTNLTVPSDRKNWGTGEPRHGVRQWAAENGLVPVGGNFFYSANDEQ
ncbi:MAG: hypothetical protein M1819_005011 [Sarea resinae]|nr:MAG: hypothetical protein M1819_005011 [Sarea resinae]